MKESISQKFIKAATVVLVSLVGAAPVSGLVLHADDVPTSKPENAVVGRWRSNASTVAIGPNHVVTTRHQYGTTGDSVWFDGVEYRIGEIRTPNQDGLENADIRVARIWTTDGIPGNLQHYAGLYAGTNETNKSIVIGGFGKGRGAELKTPGEVTYGYLWSGGNNQTQRWGANKVLTTQDDVSANSYISDTILLDFDDVGAGGWVDNEAATAEWDSGGGWFIYNQSQQQWEVAALTAYSDHEHETGETWFRHPTTGNPRPDKNWGIRISSYKTWIQDHSATWEVPPGDANLNGTVNIGDLGILGGNYGTASGMIWTDADFNSDGAVNVGDLGILGAHWEESTTGGGGMLPEPASLFLLGLGSLGVVTRRRRLC